jgi:hypothetical protein
MIDNKEKCAPSKTFSDGTCFTLPALIKIAEAYNKINADKIIINNPDQKNQKRYLLKELIKRLEKICDDQVCWINQKFIKDIGDQDILNNTFRPKGPGKQGNFEWLSTSDIVNVVKQYEHVHRDFMFLGAVPIDFDDLPHYGIKNLNYDKLYDKGIRKLGIVFNLDEHYKSGSHWVAGYVDFDKAKLYYFDSYGNVGLKNGRPDRRIVILFERIASWLASKGKKPIIKYSQKRHQHKNSECGVYSINFILRLLKKDPFEKIEEISVKDSEINKCREVYFNNDEKI